MRQSKEHDQGSQERSVETRSGVIAVDLQGKVLGGASIEFLRAEIPNKQHFPLAVVFYALEGEKVEGGLRLDLDKQVFLDHFDDEQKEVVCRRAAPELASLIASARPRLV